MTDEEKSREEIAEEFTDREEAEIESDVQEVEEPRESAQVEVAPYLEAEEDVVDAIEHVEVAQEPEIDPEPQNEDEAPEPVDEGIEIVVDGKTMRVSSNKIMAEGLRAVQKLSAADVRLAEPTSAFWSPKIYNLG